MASAGNEPISVMRDGVSVPEDALLAASPAITVKAHTSGCNTVVRVTAPRPIRLADVMPMFEDLGVMIVSYSSEVTTCGVPATKSHSSHFHVTDSDGGALGQPLVEQLVKCIQVPRDSPQRRCSSTTDASPSSMSVSTLSASASMSRLSSTQNELPPYGSASTHNWAAMMARRASHDTSGRTSSAGSASAWSDVPPAGSTGWEGSAAQAEGSSRHAAGLVVAFSTPVTSDVGSSTAVSTGHPGLAAGGGGGTSAATETPQEVLPAPAAASAAGVSCCSNASQQGHGIPGEGLKLKTPASTSSADGVQTRVTPLITESSADSALGSPKVPNGSQSSMDRYRAAAALWELDYSEVSPTRKIGEGSFGEVLLGDYRGTKVAIKRLRAFVESSDDGHGSDDGEEGDAEDRDSKASMALLLRQLFEREIEILATIRHPNVVTFIGACHTPPNVCLVTEYCARGSLDLLLHKSSMPLELSKKIEFAVDIARGMSCLHSQRPPVIHRDLKPANLLVSARLEIKVADFGLSRIKDHAMLVASRTGLEGTIEYCAPEVLRGEPYSEKCDLYSFGMVLWEILLRERPYADVSGAVFLLMISLGSGSLTLPPIAEDTAPEGLRRLVERCTDFQPANRPSFREVLSALEVEYRGVRSRAAAAAAQASDAPPGLNVGSGPALGFPVGAPPLPNSASLAASLARAMGVRPAMTPRATPDHPLDSPNTIRDSSPPSPWQQQQQRQRPYDAAPAGQQQQPAERQVLQPPAMQYAPHRFVKGNRSASFMSRACSVPIPNSSWTMGPHNGASAGRSGRVEHESEDVLATALMPSSPATFSATEEGASDISSEPSQPMMDRVATISGELSDTAVARPRVTWAATTTTSTGSSAGDAADVAPPAQAADAPSGTGTVGCALSPHCRPDSNSSLPPVASGMRPPASPLVPIGGAPAKMCAPFTVRSTSPFPNSAGAVGSPHGHAVPPTAQPSGPYAQVSHTSMPRPISPFAQANHHASAPRASSPFALASQRPAPRSKSPFAQAGMSDDPDDFSIAARPSAAAAPEATDRRASVLQHAHRSISPFANVSAFAVPFVEVDDHRSGSSAARPRRLSTSVAEAPMRNCWTDYSAPSESPVSDSRFHTMVSRPGATRYRWYMECKE